MRNETIHISGKSHLNLTFNLHQCGTNQITPGSLLRINKSEIFTLICVVNGSALLESSNTAYKLDTNYALFTFPDLAYSIQNIGESSLEIIWLSFTGHTIEHYLRRANITQTNPVFLDAEKYVYNQLDRIISASRRMPNRYCKMMSTLYDIFSYLLDSTPTKEKKHSASSDKIYALKAVSYIERNYSKNISVEEIASVLGISRKHLFSIFNNTVKITPKKYLVYYRIEIACKRLRANSQPIAEIAESVGYANQFYFAKEFKRLVGKTPNEYRKNHNTGEIFNYSKFMPTLRHGYDDYDIDLDMEEAVMAVYTPTDQNGDGVSHKDSG